MENNKFCDNQCWRCLGYEWCTKSFKKKDRYNESDENTTVPEISTNEEDDLEWWQK